VGGRRRSRCGRGRPALPFRQRGSRHRPYPHLCLDSFGLLPIADPPILSSSPRNGSGTTMNTDLSLVEQSHSSACLARSLQNVPVRPPIAQSTPSFFCTFLRISQKISIFQRLRAGCSLDTEGIGRKSQEKEGSRFCTKVAVGEPIGRLRFVLSSCLPLRLTNRWPVPQEPYRQEPFLIDEDRIGGSAISSPISPALAVSSNQMRPLDPTVAKHLGRQTPGGPLELIPPLTRLMLAAQRPAAASSALPGPPSQRGGCEGGFWAASPRSLPHRPANGRGAARHAQCVAARRTRDPPRRRRSVSAAA